MIPSRWSDGDGDAARSGGAGGGGDDREEWVLLFFEYIRVAFLAEAESGVPKKESIANEERDFNLYNYSTQRSKNDNMPERLRGWPAKPLLFQRESSNLSVVDLIFFISFHFFS